MNPARQRVCVQGNARLVSLAGSPLAPETEPLHGWAHPPFSAVLCVVLDDGREVLVAAHDVAKEDPK